MGKILIVFFLTSIFLFCGPSAGIKTVQLPVEDDPTISFRIWFKVGSQNDPEGKEGLAALTANMLVEGATTENSYEQILEKMYPLASGYSASVDKEMTVFTGRIHKDNLESYYALFKDAILSPAFKQEDFDRIKSNTLNYLERTLRYANDEAFGKEALYRILFKGTAYGHPEEGLIKSVASLTLDDVKEFYNIYYTRNNVVAGIGGGFEKILTDRLTSALATLPEGVVTTVEEPSPAPISGMELLLIEKETQSTAISFGFPIDVLRGSKDFYALWIANSWFGEHRNSASHLYQVIREARGMNYGDYSYIEHFPQGWARRFPIPNVARRQQIFEVWIRPVQNGEAHFALRAAIRELQKLVDNGMTQEEFDLTKKFLKKYYLHYAPTTSMRLGYKIDDMFYGINDHLKTFPIMLETLTLEDVNAAVKKYLQYKNIKIVLITQNAESLKKALVNNTISPKTYAVKKPAQILEEDKKIETYSLSIREESVTILKADEMFEE
jgi:zinc protease